MKPCPYCGTPWVQRDGGYIHGTIVRERLESTFCPLQGSHFFTQQMEQVTSLVLPKPAPTEQIHYEVIGGLPVMNRVGRGRPCSVEFLNDCFDFIRNKTSDR